MSIGLGVSTFAADACWRPETDHKMGDVTVRIHQWRVTGPLLTLLRTCVAVFWIAAFGIVNGCAANAPQRVPSGPPSTGSRLHVVPFESPPLVVPSGGGGLFIIPAGQTAFGIFNLMQIAAGMPGAIQRSAAATRALDAELRGGSGWEPTRVIADAALRAGLRSTQATFGDGLGHFQTAQYVNRACLCVLIRFGR